MLRIVIKNIARVLMMAVLFSNAAQAEEETIKLGGNVDEDGTVHVEEFDLPLSELISEDTRQVLNRSAQELSTFTCPGGRYPGRNKKEILAFRKCWDPLALPVISKLRERHNVDIKPETIAGIYTEVITPMAGVSGKNQKRVLINLHGGAMQMGARVGGQVESIAVAAMGNIKVISVDYRMYPEHIYPAASEDVISVYKELLKTYQAKNIGIYGCSAGAMLAARAVARIRHEKLTQPGAVGMFCYGATRAEGDTYIAMGAVEGVNVKDRPQNIGYLSKANLDDPLVYPGEHPEVLEKFPASLLLSGIRDRALSTVVYTHSQLIKLGVEADLHVWEGLGHGGFYNPDLPEFVEAHNVIVRFFDKHLGWE